MSDVPPSMELIELGESLRRKYSLEELKQLAVVLGVKMTKAKYEQKLEAAMRERNVMRNEMAGLRFAAEEYRQRLGMLEKEHLVDRLIPGLLNHGRTVPEAFSLATTLADVVQAERERLKAEAGSVATEGGAV